ncbi:hypothetical protein LTS08_000434 [Lithohypha guttulata]|nr:hypothetical protein LTS08_000434 [Lithohypha guttulata]
MARRPPGTEVDALITQYQHLSGFSRSDEALHTLRKIGSMVKPIMRQRSWHVGTLAEFYPDQQNLLGLNINHGQKIQLRLRYPGDQNQFLPIDQVLDTMLHELCHNAIGPHNEQFHALWDQLRDEQQSLVRKGYTGEGFLGNGRSLGGRRMPLHEASRLARQAAEERKKAAERARGSGQRLGGMGIMRGQDARQIIADAVERRIRIEKGCASGTAMGDRVARDEAINGNKLTTTQAGPDDENEATMMQTYIDLIQEEEREKLGGYYSPPSADNPAGSRGQAPGQSSNTENKAKSLMEQQREIEQEILREKQNQPSNPASTHRLKSTQQDHLPPPEATKAPPPPAIPPEPESTTWTCEICTLVNTLSFLSCDACGIERPSWISATLDDPQQPTTNHRKPQQSAYTTQNVLKPRSSAYDSISRFKAERAEKISRGPVGWSCVGCGNFMEAEWWTCAQCGRMKTSS